MMANIFGPSAEIYTDDPSSDFSVHHSFVLAKVGDGNLTANQLRSIAERSSGQQFDILSNGQVIGKVHSVSFDEDEQALKGGVMAISIITSEEATCHFSEDRKSFLAIGVQR